MLGITVLMLARVQASLYFINNISDADLRTAQRKHLLWNAIIFVPFYLIFAALLLTAKGVAYDETGAAQWVDYKYLHNFLEMWWTLAMFLVGTLLVLFAIIKTLVDKTATKGIWFSGIGTALVVLSLFFVAGYNNTAYYPSLLDTASSLTIRNSSSSPFTLKVMSIVSVLVPFVLAYIIYAWRSLDREKVTEKEISDKSGDKY